MGKKVAIITGSATGVGAATAVLLAEKDCNVVINYTRSKDEAMETAKLAEEKGALGKPIAKIAWDLVQHSKID